jgi:hypothetical protein
LSLGSFGICSRICLFLRGHLFSVFV